LRDVFYNKKLALKKEFIDYFYETMKTSHNLLYISRLAQLRNKIQLEKELPKIKKKILIIWGKDDKLMPLEKNADNFRLLTNSQIKIIEHAGHIPSIEKSEEFNKAVISFLTS